MGFNTLQHRKARKIFDSLLSLNGVDQYVDCGYNPNVANAVSVSKNFSISAFVMLNDDDTQNIVNHCAYTPVKGWRLFFWRTGVTTRINMDFFTTGIAKWTSPYYQNPSIKIGSLFHLCVSWEAATKTFKVYINGVYQGASNNYEQGNGATNDFDASNTLGIGQESSARGYLNGSINHLSFFNRILTESEVRYIHRLGGILPESVHDDCVAHYVSEPGLSKFYDIVEQYDYVQRTVVRSSNFGNGNTDIWQCDSGTFTRATTMYFNLFRPLLYADFSGLGINYLEMLVATSPGYAKTIIRIKDANTEAVLKSFVPVAINDMLIIDWREFTTDVIVEIEYQGGSSSDNGFGAYWAYFRRKNVHGEFVNYTSYELGLDSFQLQRNWVDVYTKNLIQKHCLLLGDGAGVNNTTSAKDLLGNYDFGIRDITLEVLLIPYGEITEYSTHSLLGYAVTNYGRVNLYISGGYGRFNIMDDATNEQGSLQFRVSDVWQIGKPMHIICQKIGNDATNWSIKLNGVEVIGDEYTTITNNTITGGVLMDSSRSGRIGCANSSVTSSRLALAYLKIWDDTTLIRHYLFNGYGRGIKDLSDNKDITIATSSLDEELSPSGLKYREIASLLPSINNTLQFDGMDQYGKVTGGVHPTNENGYTVFASFSFDQDRDFDGDEFFSNRYANQGHYVRLYGFSDRLITVQIRTPSAFYTRQYDLEGYDFTKLTFLLVTFTSTKMKIYVNSRLVDTSTYSSVAYPDFSNCTQYVIGASYLTNSYFWSGYLYGCGLAKGIATDLQVLQLWNNSLLANPLSKWSNLEWYLLSNFNQIVDDTAVSGNYLIKDYSGNGNDFALNNYSADQVDINNRVGATIPIEFTKGIFDALIKKGVVVDGGSSKELTASDSVDLGGDTDQWSFRVWTKPDNSTEAATKQILSSADAISLNINRTSSSGTAQNNRFFVDLRDTTDTRTLRLLPSPSEPIQTFNNSKFQYLGLDKLSNDAEESVLIINEERCNTTAYSEVVAGNQGSSLDTDEYAINNPVFGDNYEGNISMFMLFTGAALTQVQNDWLYNEGKGNDPGSAEAKAMGIGVSGVDVIGVNGITTLLTRYLTFDQIFEDSGNEYIREHISANNLYAQLTGYGSEDNKIIYDL